MKKNVKKLIVALVTLLLILVGIIYFAPKMNASVQLDLELSKGHTIVFNCDSTDETVIKQTSEVLEKRLANFGAIDVESTVDGSVISLSFTGDFDFDAMRKYITKTGEISFRDAFDREVMTSEVLVESMPFGVSQSGENTLLYIFVEDAKQFGATTLSISLLEQKNLVVWLDYDSSLSYAKESEKEEPAYLASALCNSAISETCYVISAHDFETTKNLVSIANSGKLPCSITEQSFTLATSSANSQANAIITGLWVTIAISSLLLIYNYKLTGLVSSLLLVGYHLLSVNIVSAFTVIFNSNVVTMLLFGLFIAIGYLFLFDHIFNQLYQSGNTVSTSLKNTFTKLAQPTVWSALFVAITVVVSYLFLRMYFLGMAITGFAIVFSFVVVIVLLHYFVLNNLFNSNYLAKNMISKNIRSTYNLVKFNYKTVSLVSKVLFALVAVGFIFFAASIKSDYLILIYGLIPLLVSTVIICGFYYLSENKVLASSTLLQVLFTVMAAGSVLVITKNASRVNVGIITIITALISALSVLFTNLLYFSCGKNIINGKSVSKAVNALNNTVTEYKNVFILFVILMLVSVVASLAFASITAKFVVALLFVVVAVLSILVALTTMYSYKSKH